MVETIWFPAPPGAPVQIHGVMINFARPEFAFNLPAHTLATLTVTLRGGLLWKPAGRPGQNMPSRFASGSRWRCARFIAAPDSIWVSLIARADLWAMVTGKSAIGFANRFFAPSELWESADSCWIDLPDEADDDWALEKAQVFARHLLSSAINALERSARRPSTDLLNGAMTLLGTRELPQVLSELAVSERRLQRLFREELGASAKTVERLLRLHRAVSTWDQRPAHVRDLADLAQAAGYSDQAHMAHDFRVLVGQPPKRLKTVGQPVDSADDLMWALREGGRLFLPEIYRRET